MFRTNEKFNLAKKDKNANSLFQYKSMLLFAKCMPYNT